MLSPERLESLVLAALVHGRAKIAPYPAVAFRLLQKVESGVYGLADLAQIVATDGVLAASVLRLANSAYYGRGSAITTLADAVGRIGAAECARVAVAASLGTTAGRPGPLAELRRNIWRRAIACALLCRELAPRRNLDPERAFTCGLLHDFGRVSTISAIEEALPEAGAGTLPEPAWLALVARLARPVGELMSRQWNLPEAIAATIGARRDDAAPSPSGVHRPMVDLLALCDGIVDLLDDCPYLLPRDFAALPRPLHPLEIERLLQLVPAIPRLVSSLEELSPHGPADAESRVDRPDTFLHGQRKDFDRPVSWTRSNGESRYRARLLTARGLRMIGRAPMFEGTVVRLRVELDEGPLEVSGRVALCRARDDGHEIEVLLFAVPGPTHDAWRQLYDRLP